VDLKDVKIGVLGGGVSGERDVSLISSKGAFDALKRHGMNVVLIDIVTADEMAVKKQLLQEKIGFAFIALHGEFGEDGVIQKILEDLNIPYTGCGVRASYLAMDKIASKELFVKYKVSTPDYTVCLNENDKIDLEYPVVVKPFFSGSSLGVSIVKNAQELPAALKSALRYTGHKALVEDYVDGRELTVGILNDKPLEVVEISPRKGFYDFNNKYGDDLTDFIAPAPIDAEMRARLQDLAMQAHRALDCRQFSRVDIRLNSKNEAYVLEVNTIPGLTSHSLLPLSAKCCGIDFDALIFTMANCAWEACRH
jgi:D-alanine-D-alanine ligase